MEKKEIGKVHKKIWKDTETKEELLEEIKVKSNAKLKRERKKKEKGTKNTYKIKGCDFFTYSPF